jgi:hypothetical protein
MFVIFFIADLMNDEDEPWPGIHCYVFITRSIGSVSSLALSRVCDFQFDFFRKVVELVAPRICEVHF